MPRRRAQITGASWESCEGMLPRAPPAHSPVLLPRWISGLRGALEGSRWGSQLGPLCPAGHREAPQPGRVQYPWSSTPARPALMPAQHAGGRSANSPRMATAPSCSSCGRLAGEEGGRPHRAVLVGALTLGPTLLNPGGPGDTLTARASMTTGYWPENRRGTSELIRG